MSANFVRGDSLMPTLSRARQRRHDDAVAQRVGAKFHGVEEVGGLNIFIERKIEESRIPTLQLGAGIRNSEFGIRNAALSPRSLDTAGGVCGNSKLKTQNSKFA